MTKVRTKKETSAYNVMEGEATVIHTETSAYYSLNETGTAIWELLSNESFSSEDIATLITNQLKLDKSEVSAEINTFFEKLKKADLTIETNEEDSADENTQNIKQEKIADFANIKSYEAPELVKFGDLETLMLSGE